MAQAPHLTSTAEREALGRALLADGLRFATLATINPDGSPHQTVIWYALEADAIVLNGADGRIWVTNLQRDVRYSLTVEDGYRWVSLRGTVERIDYDAIGQADAAISARAYHADDPDKAARLIHDRFELQQRVSFRLSLLTSKLHYYED